MKLKEEKTNLFVVVGTPSFTPTDREAEEWAMALIEMISEQVDQFNEISPFQLRALGMSCMVDRVFDLESKANHIAEQLTQLGDGNIEFSPFMLSNDTERINAKDIREVAYAVRVYNAHPFSGTTKMFLDDKQYDNIRDGGIVESDGVVVTVYADTMDRAVDIALALDMEE